MKKCNKNDILYEDITLDLWLTKNSREENINMLDSILENFLLIVNTRFDKFLNKKGELFQEYKEKMKEEFKHVRFQESDDEEDYHNNVIEYANEKMKMESLMYYQYVLMSISNLYQVFEQQLRRWIFEEMTHPLNEYLNQIEFTIKDDKSYGKFYTRFDKIEEIIRELNLKFFDDVAKSLGFEAEGEKIVESNVWSIIKECNRLSNTFKHGSGRTAEALYKSSPQFFLKAGDNLSMHFYRTTNLEEVLNIEEIHFEKYVLAMKKFWLNVIERQRGTVKLPIES